jgi:hypothetical protein
VERTSMKAVGEDPAALSEAVVGEDSAALGEAPMADPATVGEAVGEDPAVDPTAIGEAMVVQAWRRSRSRCASGGEMIVARVRV